MNAVRRARFAETYATFHGRVWAYAARRGGRELADDVAAETFLIAWRKFDQLPGDPAAWLYAVARKVLLCHLADGARELGKQSALAFERPRDFGQRDELNLWNAWAALTERDREVLALVAWEELKVRDAARVLEISPAVFSVRLHRARKRLERLLQEAAPSGESTAIDPTRSETI